MKMTQTYWKRFGFMESVSPRFLPDAEVAVRCELLDSSMTRFGIDGSPRCFPRVSAALMPTAR
jgi:hypothetical protein